MFSIKSSFADCLSCPLFSEPSCILETNAECLEEVQVIFIAENPGKDEVEKGKPLIGKAGKLFRKYFEKYGLHKVKYLLTNVVLCQTLNPDGTTGNPSLEVIERCKINCFKIIESCNPDLIVLMGASPTTAFGLMPKKAGITNIRGEKFKWNDRDVFVMLHPSYINRVKDLEPDFDKDMKKVADLIGLETVETTIHSKATGKSEVFYYKIPDKYYTSDYKLIDVQFLSKTNEVLYIFRDKNNKKEYYKTNDDYVCYQVQDPSKARKVVPYSELNQIRVPYKEKYSLPSKITYEGDLKITNKHAMDYYLLKKQEEPEIPLNVAFLDIETYSETNVHSNAVDVNDVIAIIRYSYNGVKKSFVIDPKVLKITNQVIDLTKGDVVVCSSEVQLLSMFFNDIRTLDPDIISGWYCLPKNSSIWLDDKIITISEVEKNNKLYKYGKVSRKIETGLQKSYKLNLKHGFSIEASKNHIFPTYTKEKKNVFTKKHFINGVKDRTVSEIKKEFEKNKDVYFTIERRKNKNKNYTYRDLLFENFDKFISFKDFDIMIGNDSYLSLKKNKKIRKELPFIQEYWQRPNGWTKFHGFSYKNLSKYITLTNMKHSILKQDIVYILYKNREIIIDLRKEIELEDLQLLGFMFTDGYWSKYDHNFHFDNKDVENVNYYIELINRKYLKKRQHTLENTWNKRDNLQSFYLLATSCFSVLAMMVYNSSMKKELDLTILSRLSHDQFCAFFSGMVDGDGSCYNNHGISVCCFENNKRDIKILHELLLWNYAFAFLSGNTVFVPGMNYNQFFLDKLTIHESSRKKIFENSKYYKFKNSCSNLCNKLIDDDFMILRMENINENEQEEMIDITTTSNYFISKCFKTHNCNDFDMQYIFNRAKKINVDHTKISRFGEADYNKYQYYPDAAGIVFLDMLELYKKFTFGGRESYSLDFIANLELKKGKTEKSTNFSHLFRTDINRAIEYNRNDVYLLEELDTHSRHIFFQEELKRTCKSSYKGSQSVLGQIDSLIVSFLKERGYSSKNAESGGQDEAFEGAYVQAPLVGIHEYVVDFDFTSLYPSLILTYNIGVNTFVMKLKDYQLGYDLVYNPEELPENIEIIIDPIFERKTATVSKESLLQKIKDSNLIYTINGCFFKNHDSERSFYSEVLELLLGSRKVYKKKMFDALNAKDKNKEKLYDSRQNVMKTLANTLYGALGNKAFRFFNVDSARSITLSGQEALKTVMISSENYIREKKNDNKKIISNFSKKQLYSSDMKLQFENLVTSDTDSIFLTYENIMNKNKTNDEKFIEVNELNKEVQSYLNNNVVKEIIKKHNVQEDKNRLELKNELVIKRGLFLAKKRYSNYIVSKEGNPVDEIKSMGLEIKRSDFSNITKDHLKEVLNMILKSERFSLPTVINFVKEKEKEFTKIVSSGITTIGRPVAFSKQLKEYKVIPQGVNAMLNWNNLEYKVFEQGTRGYLFKIKGINLEKAPENVRLNYDKHFLKLGTKLEVIAVPEEVECLPNYYIIDVKSMVDFAWGDRYKLLLDPLITKKQEILTF